VNLVVGQLSNLVIGLITDGSFTEGKEHIGGFFIVKASDLDTALLGRAGHSAQAAAAYDRAIALASNERERGFLKRARESLSRVH
jgi:predicted RNA polymerase sigma factor